MDRNLVPEIDLRAALLRVKTPGRYVGGELGVVRKTESGLLDVAISYPDLYEVGMSNLALRILYRRLNALDGVRCERVFAVAPDFEAELRAAAVPLYTLETGIPLHRLDLIGFSLGSELTLTNLLSILDLGGIPIRSQDRNQGPLILVGGPAATNPAPLGRFVDAVFVGEAEGWLEPTFSALARARREGAGRAELLDLLSRDAHVWIPGKGRARRAVWADFGSGSTLGADGGGSAQVGRHPARAGATGDPVGPGFPVSSIRVVQDEGSVEIMRGCPRGCRFCQAGVFYRPYRVKSPPEILAEVDNLVRNGGYSEITLGSLSSADYPGLRGMVAHLHAVYGPLGISFSLPSLRVSSVDPELVGDLAEVRKSGLTFAVETTRTPNQCALNKTVHPEEVLSLLQEARRFGWNKAKLYFMLGLPEAVAADEAEDIVSLVRRLRQATGIELRVNLGTFVPKPHTPFQDAAMLGPDEAERRIERIRRGVGRGVRVSWHDPFLSLLEGLIARGDERAAILVEVAYRGGARLDAWREYHDPDIWKAVLAGSSWDVVTEATRVRDSGAGRPWDGVDLGVTQAWRGREWERALAGRTTPACKPGCTEPCGICGPGLAARDQGWTDLPSIPSKEADSAPAPVYTRLVFSFRRDGKALYLSHLNLVTVLARSFRRAGLRTALTKGFNPRPKLELACALPLGVAADAEVGAVELADPPPAEQILARVNRVLPDGLVLAGVTLRAPWAGKGRPPSLASLVWGADYRVEEAPVWLADAVTDAVRAGEGGLSAAAESGAGLGFRHDHRAGSLRSVLRRLTGRDILEEGVRLRRLQVLFAPAEGAGGQAQVPGIWSSGSASTPVAAG